ncbi:hypothetical protein BIW11_03587 [Tropilaelaps mercedesae]|uniref:Uncharacterized protein n=1 Tax=Tropilaelaps mercedesae TaxID=418985 RepID=A0A1V9XJ31_9ACAR|nr:hypothetical protein BIW11_03587 [Tropilaelaps mercedesae]
MSSKGSSKPSRPCPKAYGLGSCQPVLLIALTVSSVMVDGARVVELTERTWTKMLFNEWMVALLKSHNECFGAQKEHMQFCKFWNLGG